MGILWRHNMAVTLPFSIPEELLLEARRYVHLFHQECGTPGDYAQRVEAVRIELERTGTYWHTQDELTYGAMVAWRNNARCIGRLHWRSLQVRDMRHLSTAQDIFSALVEHIRLATNGGKIRSMATVFAPQAPGQPGIRIWNPQLIRYAGYRQADGSIIGDPLHADLTEAMRRLGWQGARRGAFDVLPLVIQLPGQPPEIFEIPPECVLEVMLSHPEFSWFEDLGITWHALPVISNMRLEIGGISYTAAPFNGWYMGTEIGARNLGDVERYNLLPVIAQAMGLQTRSDRTLWKDRALVELNRAVLYSFERAGVTIIDHHTASRQFMHHEKHERQAGRSLYADWGWIVPPMSGSTTPVFHTPYENRQTTPNFFYQNDPWLENSLGPAL
ncbi:nitric oxide synthase oxygenase [Dictyobacter sp. S3.2.2.5]|uniref:Nitric oxide synthase oxygenase n=2 Tax=Dictyobacter halimunensis TaxID=3026934 RepID=A0ABQ6G234_9CHLR|nr:nitric oxide synthase oxygenase [Dictyobacter sp. S3.2.2.5]